MCIFLHVPAGANTASVQALKIAMILQSRYSPPPRSTAHHQSANPMLRSCPASPHPCYNQVANICASLVLSCFTKRRASWTTRRYCVAYDRNFSLPRSVHTYLSLSRAVKLSPVSHPGAASGPFPSFAFFPPADLHPALSPIPATTLGPIPHTHGWTRLHGS